MHCITNAAQRTPDMAETIVPDPSVGLPTDDEIEWTKATSEKGVAFEYGIKKSDLANFLRSNTQADAQTPELDFLPQTRAISDSASEYCCYTLA